MLKNENIICISSIDWDFIWQGHQEIMASFARNGNSVLFIENTGVRVPTFKDIPRLRKRFIYWLKSMKGFRQEMDNLYVYSPIVLPFPYSTIARWINKHLLLSAIERWTRAAEFYDPIIWTFLPTGIAVDIIKNINRKLVVYYCIADFYELADNPRKVKKTEDEIIKQSDLVFVQGSVLESKCKRLNSNVHVFPFGVKIENFSYLKAGTYKVPDDIRNIKKPIIGYVGGIHRHIDFKLLRLLSERYREWSIVLIGPIQSDISEISELQNVFLLGKKDFSKLAFYINEFDVCIIPYLKSEYTATVYPTKLNEYHALGKPVVSTDLPEIVKFNRENDNIVFVGDSHDEFVSCILKAISTSDVSLFNKRVSSAQRNSWIIRIQEMSLLMERAIGAKCGIPSNWSEKLRNFYRISRRRFLNISLILAGIYLLIFYTPLVWFIAEPLKISQVPQKVDVIVVFAGGVGESGRPGQGYEERVQYAIELYKKGFSSHLIFSSGYMYIYKEPLLMKSLAVSQGVPDSAITLEDKATNTYENVKFVKEILNKKKWNNILLISSPYHMLRASLVMKKLAPEIMTIYTPTPKNAFYGIYTADKYIKSWESLKNKQIKGILHEYLALVYYYFKGYI